MQILLGDTSSRGYLAKMREHGIGRMFAENPLKPQPGEPWALDNGAFAAWRKGTPWDRARFESRVEVAVTEPTAPLFVVLPDKPTEGAVSLAHSMRWHHRVPSWLPWYLAVQDGMPVDAVTKVLHEVDGLFLGGSDAFKHEGPMWCQLAHEHGKRFHYARASTYRRMHDAYDMGADSCDTTQPLWSWGRFNRFIQFVADRHYQPSLFTA